MLGQLEKGKETHTINGHLAGEPLPADPGLQIERRSRLSRLLPHLLVLAGLTLVTIVATWPLFPNLGGYVIDLNNPQYSVWLMAWQGHAFVTNPLSMFDANIMYPVQGTMAFDELAFTEAILAAPFYYIFGNPVLSHQIVLFATFILAGYGTWLLVRELTGSTWAGVIAGTTFGFSFYMLNHLPHMTLINTEWIPFVLLCLYKLLMTKSRRWAVGLAVTFAGNALSGHYLAFYTALLLGLFVVYYFIVERHLFTRQLWGKLFAGLGLSALLIAPVAIPYALIQSSYGFSRNLFEVERFSNTLASFLSVYRGSPVYQRLLAPFADPGPWAIERAAYPGAAAVILSILGVVLAVRYSRAARKEEGASKHAPLTSPQKLSRHAIFFAGVALLSLLLSLGPTLQITYASSDYDPNAVNGIFPLPYLLLHEWIPGFQSMRVVARIGVMSALSLAILSGIGGFLLLRWFVGWLNLGRLRRYALPALALAVALVPVGESWSAPVHMEPVATRSAVPDVYRWLAQQPQTVILEYPMTYYKRGEASVIMQNTYQYLSTYTWDDMINGSAQIRPFSNAALVNETENCFPCPRSVDAMWALGVQYVVVHLDNLSGPQRTDFLWRATAPEAKVKDEFELVKDFGADRVYRITGPIQLGGLKEAIPPGASILFGEPKLDPIKATSDRSFIGGGYMAALAYNLRDHAEYGSDLLSLGQTLYPVDPAHLPDYALLWAKEDPVSVGYRVQDRAWSNEHVALYKRPPGAEGR